MGQHEDQVYHSFLVRCWLMPRTLNSESPIWRFEVKEVTAEPGIHRFSDLEDLKAFLAAELAAMAGPGNQEIDEE